jgi:hypothetical protein
METQSKPNEGFNNNTSSLHVSGQGHGELLQLEHFSYLCRAAKGSLNQAIASSAVSSGSSSVMA